MGEISVGTVNLKDLPPKFRDDAWRCIKWHTVALVSEKNWAASGTLIQWGNEFGILTAYHVTKAFKAHPESELLLSIADFPHRLGFRVEELKSVDVGVPERDDIGPDVSLFLLPQTSALAELKTRKSFFNISRDRVSKEQAALEDLATWWIAGYPQQHVRVESLRGGSGEAINVGTAGFGVAKARRYERGDFDYVEIAIPTDWHDCQYGSFGGLSGGGVWRVLIHKDPQTGEFFFKDCVLAGVVFYESTAENGRRRILSHGGRSIYQKVLQTLQIR